jgi:hypothetical protein
MKPGRLPSLSYPKLRIIDLWFSQPGRKKKPPMKVIAARVGVSVRTIHDAARRRNGYTDCPIASIGTKSADDCHLSIGDSNEQTQAT